MNNIFYTLIYALMTGNSIAKILEKFNCRIYVATELVHKSVSTTVGWPGVRAGVDHHAPVWPQEHPCGPVTDWWVNLCPPLTSWTGHYSMLVLLSPVTTTRCHLSPCHRYWVSPVTAIFWCQWDIQSEQRLFEEIDKCVGFRWDAKHRWFLSVGIKNYDSTWS